VSLPTDAEITQRANAYAHEVLASLGTMRGAVALDAADVARAFVIGFAAGAVAAAEHVRDARVRGRGK